MKKRHIALLQDISRSIPKELTDALMIEVDVTPSWKKDVETFLKTGTSKNKLLLQRFKDKRKQLQNLYDSGMFSMKTKVADPKIEKKINEFLDGRIEQAIKDGLLPPKKDKLKTKAKQHGKRTRSGEDKGGEDRNS